MLDVLKDVGKHVGSWGNGHYEASVQNDGSVVITTVFNDAQQKLTVKLNRAEWDRLIAWVEWQRKK